MWHAWHHIATEEICLVKDTHDKTPAAIGGNSAQTKKCLVLNVVQNPIHNPAHAVRCAAA
jgi:hypothetical protein